MSRLTIARALYESEYEVLRLRTRNEALEEENAYLKEQIEDLKKIKMGDFTDILVDGVLYTVRRLK